MFARSRNPKKKVRPLSGVDQDFTNVVKPLLKKTIAFNSNSAGSVRAPSPVRPKTTNLRTGDSSSYYCSHNDNTYVHRSVPRRGFRVLAYTEQENGKINLFDILNGKPYHCGYGKSRKITSNAVVFESKEAALSERFPANQARKSKFFHHFENHL